MASGSSFAQASHCATLNSVSTPRLSERRTTGRSEMGAFSAATQGLCSDCAKASTLTGRTIPVGNGGKSLTERGGLSGSCRIRQAANSNQPQPSSSLAYTGLA